MEITIPQQPVGVLFWGVQGVVTTNQHENLHTLALYILGDEEERRGHHQKLPPQPFMHSNCEPRAAEGEGGEEATIGPEQ